MPFVTFMLTSLLVESDRVITGQEKYNMATFMVIFLLVTIEVMVIKVVTAESEREEDNMRERSLAVYFDDDNWICVRINLQVLFFLGAILWIKWLFLVNCIYFFIGNFPKFNFEILLYTNCLYNFSLFKEKSCLREKINNL